MKHSTSYYVRITQHFFQLILFLLCHPPRLHAGMLISQTIDLPLLLNPNERSVQASLIVESHYNDYQLMLIVA